MSIPAGQNSYMNGFVAPQNINYKPPGSSPLMDAMGYGSFTNSFNTPPMNIGMYSISYPN